MPESIEILNIRGNTGLTIKPHKEYDFYIDKRTPVGNPFLTGRDGNRNDVCDLYDIWFYKNYRNKKIKEYLQKITDAYTKFGKVRLFCWCRPMRCHGETIKKYLEEMENG